MKQSFEEYVKPWLLELVYHVLLGCYLLLESTIVTARKRGAAGKYQLGREMVQSFLFVYAVASLEDWVGRG
jgi:hypothetical protein